MRLEPIKFKNDQLVIIDQTKLPADLIYIKLSDLASVCEAIRSLKTRGAPAIGIVAAYGMYVAAKELIKNGNNFLLELQGAGDKLKSTRPTAVNLSWAVDRMLSVAKKSKTGDVVARIKEEAQNIHNEDRVSCDYIGQLGSTLFCGKKNILTHCNAGILATGGIGTALAPLYKVHENGQPIHVYVDETRPVGQGARLTYWELSHNQVPCTLITDSMASVLMVSGNIDGIIVGADRIAANGDVANKIGTYNLAVAADYHKIPFYVAAPISTFDLTLESGEFIPIEERSGNEILDFWDINDTSGYDTFNPAFDITPHQLITAIITPKEIIERPNKNKIYNLFN